jgi:hypothetical protein
MSEPKYDLEETIAASPIDIVVGPFIMVRLPPAANVPSSALASFRDSTELTVVVLETDVPRLESVVATEGPFALLRVRVSIPFLVQGFLAAIAVALAEINVNVLIWSTFSYDYAFVRSEKLDDSLVALTKRGFPMGRRA